MSFSFLMFVLCAHTSTHTHTQAVCDNGKCENKANKRTRDLRRWPVVRLSTFLLLQLRSDTGGVRGVRSTLTQCTARSCTVIECTPHTHAHTHRRALRGLVIAYRRAERRLRPSKQLADKPCEAVNGFRKLQYFLRQLRARNHRYHRYHRTARAHNHLAMSWQESIASPTLADTVLLVFSGESSNTRTRAKRANKNGCCR